MTQAPTPGPLSGDDVKLLVAQGWHENHGGRPHATGADVDVIYRSGRRFRFQPWMSQSPWAMTYDSVWSLDRTDTATGILDPIVCWRPHVDDASLAPTAPVEASGSEREMVAAAAWNAARAIGLADGEDDAGPWPPTAGQFGWQEDDSEACRNVELAKADAAIAALRPQPSGETREISVDDLANEIRLVDGNHDLGAGALAEALMPFLSARPLALGGQHSSATDFPPDDVLACVEGQHSSGETIEQRFPALNDHLIRMASSGSTGSLTEWGAFFECLRAALSIAPVAETAGEAVAWQYRHPDGQWGDMGASRISVGAPAVNAPSNFECRALYTPPVPDDKLRIPAKWFEVAEYATERGLAVHESNIRMEEFRRVVSPEALAALKSEGK